MIKIQTIIKIQCINKRQVIHFQVKKDHVKPIQMIKNISFVKQ